MQFERAYFIRHAGILLTLALFCASCSVYMEASRPTPTHLSEFQLGQTRDSVLERLGAPISTATESDGASCDLYSLYTKGYGAAGKIPIAIAEGIADGFTLGLAEVILTPAEGLTRNDKHPITFCYKSQKLVRVTGTGAPPSESATTTASSDAWPGPPNSAPTVTAPQGAAAAPTTAAPTVPPTSAGTVASTTSSVSTTADAASPEGNTKRGLGK
jgi:hypothetical protein